MRVRRGSSRSAPAATPSAARGPVRPGATGQRRGAHAGPPARETGSTHTRTAAPIPNPGLTRASWHRLRPRTVRAKIVALLMVPVVSVMALWSFATVTTAQNVWDLLRLQEVNRTLLGPVDATVAGLQAERAAAGQLLAAPGAARESALREAAGTTDRAVAPLNLGDRGTRYNRADAQGLGAEAADRVDALGAAVGALPALRSRILARSVSWDDAYAGYNAAIDRAFDVTGAVSQFQDHRVASDARVLLEFARSRELLAREDALLRTGQSAGSLSGGQLRDFGSAVFARRLFEQSSERDLRPADRAALTAVTGGADYRDLTRSEDAVASAADGNAATAAVGPEQWAVAADSVARALRAVEVNAGAVAAAQADPYALGLFTPSGAAVLLGLVAVIASLLISVQIGRGLVTELIALRNSALELAGRKLPATMRRLRAGEEIDVDAEVPLRPHGDDEIGQVHGALGSVQRAAVTAAVERAEVLSGVSGVFVNLARRSQVLVHRQLTLLDTMERRTEDPAELDDLFKLDHLTTRMRRHAEGLIILSGAAPGRAWRKPVPLMDVVRAAVAEVEEYARVEVHRLPFAAVMGPAVADLTHLVAELVENATGFSPPHTKVHIRGEQVGNGYALEIEDRGLGMGAEALADANRRIEAAQQVDLFDSDRLGLFVVSRLAKRQGVRVALRPSAYGGTTAVVLLPNTLLETRQESEPPAPAAAGAPPQPRRAVAAPAADRVEALPAEAPPAPCQPPTPEPVRPFGAQGADPGVLRPTPFAANGTRPPRLPAPPAPAPAPVPVPPAPAPVPPAPAPVPPAPAPAPVPVPSPAAPPRPPVAPVVPVGLAKPAADPSGEGELPRRVRQASLAPQLRQAPPKPEPKARIGGDGPPRVGRNPEEARAAMSAYQQGWARGKNQRPSRPVHEPVGLEGRGRPNPIAPEGPSR